MGDVPRSSSILQSLVFPSFPCSFTSLLPGLAGTLPVCAGLSLWMNKQLAIGNSGDLDPVVKRCGLCCFGNTVWLEATRQTGFCSLVAHSPAVLNTLPRKIGHRILETFPWSVLPPVGQLRQGNRSGAHWNLPCNFSFPPTPNTFWTQTLGFQHQKDPLNIWIIKKNNITD